MKPHVIGVDFGSDSVRAAVIDLQGNIQSMAVAEYPRWKAGLYCDRSRSQFRQHPLDHLECLVQVIREVLQSADPGSIAGIGIDTTGSTPCPLDAAGMPLALRAEFSENPDAMFYLWKDHTALQESSRINEVIAGSPVDYTMYEGSVYSPEWFWAKLLYMLRHAPQAAAAAHSFAEHCDWLPALLTGGRIKAGRCAAGHKAMWHPDWGGLPPQEFLSSVDPLLDHWREKLYTETFTAEQRVGFLSPEWAEKLGLSTRVAVAGGVLDCHAGAVGAGIREGTLVKIVGTSTCDIAVARDLQRNIRGICGQVAGSVVPGMIGLEAGQSAFGDIYDWFKRFLNYYGKVSLAELEKEASLLEVDPELVALDWHNGRRTPFANALLRGAINGLTLGSTPPMVYRALVEATAFGSKKITDHYAECGIPVDTIIASGGIAKKSPLVMQICADVLNKPIQIAESEQTCALGAGIFAAVAAGCYANVPEAMAQMSSGISAEYRPDPGRSAVYAEKYRRYCALGAAAESLTASPALGAE